MASPTPFPATAPPPHRRGEHGVSILLAMLVLFVLTVVVFEVRYSAQVELDHAGAFVDGMRMTRLAEAAARQTQSVLLMDVEQAQDTSGSGAGGGGGDSAFGGGGDMFGGDGGGGGGDEGGDAAADEASVADTTARTDSFLDEWNNPTSLAPAMGEDLKLYIEVIDEDRKINLLGLWSPDDDARDAWREIVSKLLDRAFEGTSRDISFGETTDILDKLDDWVRGNRGSFDPIPSPPLKKSNQEEEEEGDGLDTSLIDNDERHFFLTIDELKLIEGIEPEHVTGFVEDDEWHPGLADYLTVWSHLEVKPKPPESDDPFSGSPFTQGSLFDKPSGDPSEATTGDEEEPEPQPTNDGLININTAPLAVLRALAPDEISISYLERVIEFRERIYELRDEGVLSAGDSLFAQFDPDYEDSQDTDSGFDNQTDDITHYVFEMPEEVIDTVEEEYSLSLNLDPGVQSAFVTRLGVTSQVFTVQVLVYTIVDDPRTGREEFGTRRSYRTTFWRMIRDDGVRALTLIPLEAYYDPRRMEDFGEDLVELSDAILTGAQAGQ